MTCGNDAFSFLVGAAFTSLLIDDLLGPHTVDHRRFIEERSTKVAPQSLERMAVQSGLGRFAV